MNKGVCKTEINKKLFEEMQSFDLYQGLNNKIIMMEDRIDNRFYINDLFDLVSCTLLYHQLIECMMYSLLIHFKYLDELINNKLSDEKNISIDGFANILKKIKKIKYVEFFEEKEELVKVCNKINKLRNKMAHGIINYEEKEMIRKMNEVKNIYHYIQNMYQTVSIRIFNYVHNEINDFSILALQESI